MSGFQYVSKSAKVHVKTLTTSWVQVLTAAQCKSCRGVKVKSRYVYPSGVPGPFDLAFVASPQAGDTTDGDGFISSSGGTLADTFSPSNGLWAKSVVDGTVIEMVIYE